MGMMDGSMINLGMSSPTLHGLPITSLSNVKTILVMSPFFSSLLHILIPTLVQGPKNSTHLQPLLYSKSFSSPLKIEKSSF